MANFSAWWKIEYSPDYRNGAHLELTDADREHIAGLIQQGYTEGEIVADETEDDDSNTP